MNGDGVQAQAQVPLPPLGEPLFFGTGQLRWIDGSMVVVLTLTGPGRQFVCLLTGDDALNWGTQLRHYGEVTKAGLFVQGNTNESP